jgi:uncharacterized repeat protein (TIGR02543 family)
VTASGGKFTFSGGVLGLVVGRNEHKSSVASSYNAGNIKASGGDENYAGGVAGVNEQNCTLTNCSNAGSATASGGSDSHAGGVVGLNNDALNNCYNTGSVNASGSSRSPHAGGVVGLNSHDYATTANCYWLSGTAATAVENISGTVVNCASFTDEAGALTLGGNTSETNTLTASTLLDALNAWVQEQTIPSDYLGWTVITDVNGGYPVLRPWYTAAFNANGGAVATESKAIVIGGGYGSLPTPTRSGYTFAGWFTDAAGGTPVTADTTVAITADQMLYARWHIPYVPPAVSVPVTGGSGRSMNVDVTTSGSSVIVNSPSASKLQDVISSAEAVERPVSIDLSSLGDNLDMAVLPSSLLSGVAGSDAPGLSVTMPDGKGVSFDQTALGALISAGSGHLKLGVRQVPAEFLTDAQRSLLGSAPVLDLTVFVGTTQVHGFGGGFVTVSIPVDGEPVEHPIIWRMTSDVDGKVTLEAIECIYNLETKCYVFQTDSFSEYVLGNYPFIDTPDTAWYYEDVVYTYVNGLFSGTDDTAFSPDMTMTRGMLVMVLWRMEGSPAVADAADFSDIVSSAWYADAVAWAAENEIVTGYGENKFGPEDNITREQMAVVLYRYAQYKGYDVSVGEDTNILSYEDAFDIAEYAIPSIQWACGASLMQGSDGYLMPQGDADRAQVAAILHRFNVNVSK